MKKKYRVMIEQGRILGILLCIFVLIGIIISYMGSVHNLDLIHNLQIVIGTINNAGLYTANGTQIIIPFDKISDTGSDFVSRNLIDFYVSSSNNLKNKFIWGIIDAIFLGLLIGGWKNENNT